VANTSIINHASAVFHAQKQNREAHKGTGRGTNSPPPARFCFGASERNLHTVVPRLALQWTARREFVRMLAASRWLAMQLCMTCSTGCELLALSAKRSSADWGSDGKTLKDGTR
jgi:hypothetical protein